MPPSVPDPAVERLLSRGPDMCLTTEEESAGRAAALEEAVYRQTALAAAAIGQTQPLAGRGWRPSTPEGNPDGR